MQHGFGFNLTGCKSVDNLAVRDAYEKDGSFLELRGEDFVDVSARLFSEVLDGFFGNETLELSKAEHNRLEASLVIDNDTVDGAVEVVALARALRAVCELRFGENESAELHLESADVCLECRLCGVLAVSVDGRGDGKLRLAPILDAFAFELFLEEFSVEFFFDAVEHGAYAKAEVAMVECEGSFECRVHVLLRDVVFFDHATKHVFETLLATSERLFAAFCASLDKGVVVEGTLDGPCDKGAFGKREVLEVLVEEILCCDGDALACSRYMELV